MVDNSFKNNFVETVKQTIMGSGLFGTSTVPTMGAPQGTTSGSDRRLQARGDIWEWSSPTGRGRARPTFTIHQKNRTYKKGIFWFLASACYFLYLLLVDVYHWFCLHSLLCALKTRRSVIVGLTKMSRTNAQQRRRSQNQEEYSHSNVSLTQMNRTIATATLAWPKQTGG